MKKFIKQLMIFILPFFVFALLFQLFYSNSGGDLSRIGKISVDRDYRTRFINHESLAYDTEINELKHYDFITIGDSFSSQGNNGYQQFLAKKYGYKILDLSSNYDDLGNPLIFAIKLSNSNFFDEVKTDYLVVQLVERSISRRTEIDSSSVTESIKPIFMDRQISPKKPIDNLFGYIKDSIQFIMVNILYYFDDNALFNQVYKVDTIGTLFSVEDKSLLFYYNDLLDRENSNLHIDYESKLEIALSILNDNLSKHDVKLVFLIAPDKLSIYSDHIKRQYPNSIYSHYIENSAKDFIFINSHHVLKRSVDDGVLDVYYYDDSHWSPIGAEVIATEISKVINSS